MRGRLAEGKLVAETVNVDVTLEAIDIAPGIFAVLQTFEPQNAVGDRSLGHALPGEADRDATAKHRADHVAAADFSCDPMQAQRCLVGILFLSNTESGGGNDEALLQ